MDADFQTHYLLAEEAYGAGDFQKARRISYELLNQLESMLDSEQEQEALLAWRACVALLAGHIELYGFQDPAQAKHFYELVLASKPQDTLQELAEQGLERTRSDQESVTGTEPMADPVEGPSTESEAATASLTLIADPFLSAASRPVNSVETTVVTTAMPWLSNGQSNDDPEPSPSSRNDGITQPLPDPELEPVPQSISDPLPETTSAITALDSGQSHADPEPSPSSRNDGITLPLPQPELKPVPQSISDPLPETTSAITALDSGQSHADPEPSPSSRNDGITEPLPQPEADNELVESSVAEFSTTETQTSSDPEVSDEIRTRLEAGSLVVRLQDLALKPTETSSKGHQARDRWLWLRTALRRS